MDEWMKLRTRAKEPSSKKKRTGPVFYGVQLQTPAPENKQEECFTGHRGFARMVQDLFAKNDSSITTTKVKTKENIDIEA